MVLLLLFTQCKPTKYVPKGEQLLVRNTVQLNNTPVKDASVTGVIRQKPNKKLSVPWVDPSLKFPGFRFSDEVVIWRPYLMLYNWGKPEKEKGFGHWLTEIGEAPIILDSIQTLKSARQIGQYYYNNGYFLNEVEFQIELLRDSTRAKVLYNVFSGPQYYFNKVEYIISSPGILEIVQGIKKDSKITAGKPYSAQALEEERDRLVTELRNNGYYGFPKNLIRYNADTSAGNHNVDITLLVSDQVASVGDSIYYIEHMPFTLKNVIVDPNYSFRTNETLSKDTVGYKSLIIWQKQPRAYRPNYIESQVHIKPGELYNEQKVKETYSHLTGNRVFQMADISFEKVPGDTTNGLNAIIKIEPYDRRTFTAETELTNTAGNWGVAGVLTFSSRNVFGLGGGEVSDLSFRGGLEAQVNINDNYNIFNTKEIGVEYGITYPRFLLAGGLNQKIPKRMEPTSRIYTSFNYQTRVEFERNILALGLQYNWRETRKKLHQVNLLEINYVHLPRINQDYLNSLEFKTGFQDNLIMAIRYTFVYNTQTKAFQRFRYFLRTSVETSGNVLSAANGSGNFAHNDETDQYLVLGVPYAQYVKLDFDFRAYFNPSPTHQFATRLFLGSTYNYGNSPYLPPFEKSFLAGGSNDMRGWNAYRLGPGNFPKHLYTIGTTSYAAVAPIKIMANVEYRFPIIESFKGAIFLDVGNIWLWDRDYNNSGFSEVEEALVDYGIFKLDQFYKQMAVNTGIGFRYDFGFFAFRLDMGVKIWDPTEPVNQRYVLSGLKWNNITYNIALGYPF